MNESPHSPLAVRVQEGCHKAAAGSINVNANLPALGLVQLLQCSVQLLNIIEVTGVGGAQDGNNT